MSKFNLDPGETELHNQTVLYTPPKGGKYNGKLVITNTRLLYDAKFDMSASGILEEVLFIKSGSEGYLQIPKNRIKDVEVQKSLFVKKVILTLDNNEKHIFNAGALSVDKIVEAIKK